MKRWAAVAGALAVLSANLAPAAAYPAPGVTERVSVTDDGAEANGMSFRPDISGDGRYVTFESGANNLVPGDTNGAWDVFVRDRWSGTIGRVSVATDGAEGNAQSFQPVISADGRVVAFTSAADNLAPGDVNESWDVFVHDRETGVTERVSVATGGWEANADSYQPSISADGRYVAFRSNASDLVPGDTNGESDIFVHDRETGSTERVSVTSGGAQADQGSFEPSISADGRYVAFNTWGPSNLSINPDAWYADVFVHDRETGVTTQASVTSDGTPGNRQSREVAISGDGRYLAFASFATNLVPHDGNGDWDVFVHDQVTGTTERVSVSSDGSEGRPLQAPGAATGSRRPSISADGRFVAFESTLADLAPGDANGLRDIFVHDRGTVTTERVSVASGGTGANSHAERAFVTDDGGSVAFNSAASNLASGITNGTTDVFVRDRGPAVGVGALHTAVGDGVVAVSGWARFAGALVTSGTAADDPEPGATEVGMELAGASIIARPEQEDLLVRLEVPHYLSHPWGLGAPGLLYVVEFDYAGATWQVRAHRGETGEDVDNPSLGIGATFSLYACDDPLQLLVGQHRSCWFHTELSGGIAEARHEVTVAVPYGSAGLPADSGPLTDVTVLTGVGAPATGIVHELHRVDLPDGVVPLPVVEVGIVDADSGDEVASAQALNPVEGAFAATLDTGDLPAGEYTVWARACLRADCHLTESRLTR